MSTVKIITVDKSVQHWCPQIAMLHSSRITAGFLPLLGLPLLTRVYRHAAKEAILLAAVDGDELLGFAMGSVSVRRFYLRFVMHNLFPLGFNLLRRPAILRRALSGAQYAAQTEAAAAPELLSIAVSTRRTWRRDGADQGMVRTYRFASPTLFSHRCLRHSACRAGDVRSPRRS